METLLSVVLTCACGVLVGKHGVTQMDAQNLAACLVGVVGFVWAWVNGDPNKVSPLRALQAMIVSGGQQTAYNAAVARVLDGLKPQVEALLQAHLNLGPANVLARPLENQAVNTAETAIEKAVDVPLA